VAVTQQCLQHGPVWIGVGQGGYQGTVQRNVHLREQAVQKQIHWAHHLIWRKVCAIGLDHLGLYVEQGVAKVNVIVSGTIPLTLNSMG